MRERLLTRRRSQSIWLAVMTLIVVLAVLREAEGLLLVAMMVMMLVYGVYLYVLWVLIRARQASVEGNRLLVKTKDGRTVASVALHEPFDARCVHYDGEWALYRVVQARSVARFAVSRSDTGELVKALRLTWPPSVTPYGSWLR